MKLVVDFILIFGIVLNALALFGLLRVKNKKLPQLILIVFWTFTVFVFLYFYASLHQLYILKTISFCLENGVRLFIPPLLYLYIQSIFYPKKNLVQKNFGHFVPFLLFLIFYNLPKVLALKLSYLNFSDHYLNWGLLQDLFGIVYFGLALKIYYSLKKTVVNQQVNLTTQDFFWLEKFLFSFLMVLLVDLMITLNELIFGYSVFWDAYITVFFLLCAMLYIGYYGLTQSTVFLPSFLAHDGGVVSIKRTKSVYLNKNEITYFKNKYDDLMETDRLYLEKDLSLSALARKMEISPRKLSAFFNEVLGSSFNDSINRYRVEEAKGRLRANALQQYTIAGIGFSCGFKSKSSFYRIFKKFTGISPLAYIEKTLKESQDER